MPKKLLEQIAVGSLVTSLSALTAPGVEHILEHGAGLFGLEDHSV